MTMEEFLNQYNPGHDPERALNEALRAAIQRNPSYTPGLTNGIKDAMKNFWRQELRIIGAVFEENQTRAVYFGAVEKLKITMNEQFGEVFQHQKTGYDQGFRIAHAQKSISVYLKHLYCMGVIPAPPCCPVDWRISQKAGVQMSPPWTKMNSIEQLANVLQRFDLLALQQEQLLCDWELELF